MSRPQIVVRPARFSDAIEFADKIRQADVDEIDASVGLSPEMAIKRSLELSSLSWSAVTTDGPLCVFGIAPSSILTGYGIPWLMATDLIEPYQFAFLRLNRHYIGIMRRSFPRQLNYVDDRHEAAKRWLGWLGFKLNDPEPYGVKGLPFRRFWYQEDVKCVPQSY